MYFKEQWEPNKSGAQSLDNGGGGGGGGVNYPLEINNKIILKWTFNLKFY